MKGWFTWHRKPFRSVQRLSRLARNRNFFKCLAFTFLCLVFKGIYTKHTQCLPFNTTRWCIKQTCTVHSLENKILYKAAFNNDLIFSTILHKTLTYSTPSLQRHSGHTCTDKKYLRNLFNIFNLFVFKVQNKVPYL